MALLVTFAKEPTFVVSPNLMYPPLKSQTRPNGWCQQQVAEGCLALARKHCLYKRRKDSRGDGTDAGRKGCYA